MKPLVLCIMDGVGIREEIEGNAFKQANTPNLDKYMSMYPNSLLEAAGEAVGLPEDQMGNSEVGHLNIGAGRVIRQPLEIINDSIKDKSFYNNKELLNAINHSKENNSKLHIIGLLSDGGVHSHINHFISILELAKQNNLTNVYIHVLTDGRDTKRDVALKYLDILQGRIDKLQVGTIASISGRYYSMDRDNRWDRTELGYSALISNAKTYTSYKELIEENYKNEIYDEFIKPGVIDTNSFVNNNDSIIFANFRSDRLRQLGLALTNKEFDEFQTKDLSNIKLTTLFPVDQNIISNPAFIIPDIKNDLGEYISNLGLKQLRIAETEKYAHVTYFFNGGEDNKLQSSDRVSIPSPKVETYDLKPEMSAIELTDKVLEQIENYELIVLNYANGDMVGHTGKIDAAIKAVETVDKCVSRVHDKVKELNGTLLITADHGNCEDMTGKNKKTHTTNAVPLILCKEGYNLSNGKLSDIAPTILTLMNLDIPEEMTGNVLTS